MPCLHLLSFCVFWSYRSQYHIHTAIYRMKRDYTSQGTRRFQEEIRLLEGSPDVIFHGTEDTIRMILLNMPRDCPSTFTIRVGHDYPRHPPVVRCSDDVLENKYINRDKILTHPDLKHRYRSLRMLMVLAYSKFR